ncbi:MAG: hypothetical protein WBG42_15670 [Cryomorphaceae bacterium]
MKQQSKGHNVAYLRRLAKKIKKEKKLTHHQSLDAIAADSGFRNWKHLLKTHNDCNSDKVINPNVVPKGQHLNPYRNLLVAAINELVKTRSITLNPQDFVEAEGSKHIFIELFGHQSVIIWRSIGFDELHVSVWWKYDHNKHPQANLEGTSRERFNHSFPLAKNKYFKNFVGVTVSCWLERRNGKYIQGENKKGIFDIYTRRGEFIELKQLPTQKAKGFMTTGPVHY